MSKADKSSAFTLLELLVVAAVLTLLLGILAPSLVAARGAAKKTLCAANMRAMFTATMIYYEANRGQFFPFRQDVTEGVLWYWGLEPPGASQEGSRPLDRSRAKLAGYISQSVRFCPALSADMPYFKPKFDLAGYGYAINQYMLSEWAGKMNWHSISRPFETVVWADSMQINTFQAPASPTNPMLEEWYYLSNRSTEPANFHFRHDKGCNAAFADGTVRTLKPYWLDVRCDRLVGRPEKAVNPPSTPQLLRLDK